MAHKNCCRNGCIRRMDIEDIEKGYYTYYKGTMDCPAQISLGDDFWRDQIEAIEICGCCSFDDGSKVTAPTDCRLREGDGDWATCECHNTRIVYTTCLSKRNYGVCPYGLGV